MAAGRGRSRRVSLPGVADLLRPAAPGPDGSDQRRASGRERHTQKITVYLSAEELLDLERARLALLRYGAAADRGRIANITVDELIIGIASHPRKVRQISRIGQLVVVDDRVVLTHPQNVTDEIGTDEARTPRNEEFHRFASCRRVSK